MGDVYLFFSSLYIYKASSSSSSSSSKFRSVRELLQFEIAFVLIWFSFSPAQPFFFLLNPLAAGRSTPTASRDSTQWENQLMTQRIDSTVYRRYTNNIAPNNQSKSFQQFSARETESTPMAFSLFLAYFFEFEFPSPTWIRSIIRFARQFRLYILTRLIQSKIQLEQSVVYSIIPRPAEKIQQFLFASELARALAAENVSNLAAR